MQLLITDTAGIQAYVFGSNLLRENAGGSYLAARALEDWAPHVLDRQLKLQTNLLRPRRGTPRRTKYTIDRSRKIEANNDLDAEILYIGGGNALLLFRKDRDASDFIRVLSRRMLAQSPGLRLVTERRSFDWHHQVLVDELAALTLDLERRKQAPDYPQPLRGLGVTERCQLSSGPATARVDIVPGKTRLVSNETKARLSAARSDQNNRSRSDSLLRSMLDFDPRPNVFPHELDDLGAAKGEHSYIAVVHVDGNDIGNRLGQVVVGADNRRSIENLRDFSAKLKEATRKSLSDLLKDINALAADGRISHPLIKDDPTLEIDLRRCENGFRLPIRPLISAGDDITFVCDGRLGLSLAVQLLKYFERNARKLPPKGAVPATACAGVAIVKSHYPFSRAYELAEQLCASAKTYRREQGIAGSCLDWHFATAGVHGDLAAIRRREYHVPNPNNPGGTRELTLRPVTLGDNPKQPLRAWPVVASGIETFQHEWRERRNKLKDLRVVIRDGEKAVKQFLKNFRLSELPEVSPTFTDLKQQGWQGDQCGYFDAIEAADWYIPLSATRQDQPGGA